MQKCLLNSRYSEQVTDFLPWSSRYFTRQLMRHECAECDCDQESPRHWMQEWLYGRNLEVQSVPLRMAVHNRSSFYVSLY